MENNGISFIVIGKNEGWKITLCLKSILNCIKENSLTNYEIIYVDSKSIDDSLDRVKLFQEVRIFNITGVTNAAIARNVGALESTKNVLFFIDGDMEIIPETFNILYDETKGLLKRFVSGNFKNLFYSKCEEYLESKVQYNYEAHKYEIITGGLFLTTKDAWDKIGGMRGYFRIAEDWDLGLRMSINGNKLYRIKEVLALHHTISYNRNDRMWKDVKNGDFLYYKTLIYRSHIFNKYMYKLLIREVTMFSLIIIVMMAIVLKSPYLLVSYLLIVLLKLFYKRKRINGNLVAIYVRYIIFDIGTILGFFLFWPKKINKLEYIKLE